MFIFTIISGLLGALREELKFSTLVYKILKYSNFLLEMRSKVHGEVKYLKGVESENEVAFENKVMPIKDDLLQHNNTVNVPNNISTATFEHVRDFGEAALLVHKTR